MTHAFRFLPSIFGISRIRIGTHNANYQINKWSSMHRIGVSDWTLLSRTSIVLALSDRISGAPPLLRFGTSVIDRRCRLVAWYPGHRKMCVAGCVHCVHLRGLACRCVPYACICVELSGTRLKWTYYPVCVCYQTLKWLGKPAVMRSAGCIWRFRASRGVVASEWGEIRIVNSSTHRYSSRERL